MHLFMSRHHWSTTMYQRPPLSIIMIHPLLESMIPNSSLLMYVVLKAPPHLFWNLGYFILYNSCAGHRGFVFMKAITMVYSGQRVSLHTSSLSSSYILFPYFCSIPWTFLRDLIILSLLMTCKSLDWLVLTTTKDSLIKAENSPHLWLLTNTLKVICQCDHLAK